MSKRLIFTEGPFDAKAVHARVRPSDGGLGVLGTSFSQEKADAVADLPAEDCIVFMDGDAPGMAAAAGIAKKLIAVGKRVFVTYPPDALDPEVDELDLALEGL
jgi:DNA primase